MADTEVYPFSPFESRPSDMHVTGPNSWHPRTQDCAHDPDHRYHEKGSTMCDDPTVGQWERVRLMSRQLHDTRESAVALELSRQLLEVTRELVDGRH